MAGNLSISILDMCPNQDNLLLRISSMIDSVTFGLSRTTEFCILSLLEIPIILLRQFISTKLWSFHSSSVLSVQHSEPYARVGTTNALYTMHLSWLWIWSLTKTRRRHYVSA